MGLFLKYLKQRRRYIAAGAAFCAVFALSFYFYRLPPGAVLYPAALCALLAVIFVIIDFLRVRKLHIALSGLKTPESILLEDLPLPDGVTEEDYQNLIDILKRGYTGLSAENNRRLADTVSYYTVWVHQIKTPIAAMKLALQNEDAPAARRLSNELFRIEQYVEMVLTYLRLNADSTDYLIKEYDLDKIIRRSVKKFAGEFIERKLTLSYTPADAQVITDEKWLSFVIEQVLSNALKYTPSGEISVYFENGKIVIKDTGIGIAPEDLRRIFESGYTGCNGRRDKQASGLGLYLCRQICENLGHKISAESAVGEGTTVLIDVSRKKTVIE